MECRIVTERDPETGDWAAWCPELPGCASAGETKEAALENIREAIALYLEPDGERWDRKIARDANEGKLDFLLEEARNARCRSSVDESNDRSNGISGGKRK